MESNFDKVVEFNQLVLGVEPRAKGLQSREEMLLSVAQLKEEIAEYIEAHTKSDYIGAVDACIDSLYFTYGVLYKLGLNAKQVDEIFDIVHCANMRKRKGVKEGREGFGGAADATKPEGWESPEDAIARALK